VVDMFAHWRYLLDHTFGAVKAVQCTAATHIPERVDERGRRYKATADDAAYATFVLAGPDGDVVAQFNSSWAVRVYRDDLLQIQVDGTAGSAVAGLRDCWTQRRDETPRAVWNPDVPGAVDYYAPWQGVPDEERLDNAFKVEWEMFLLHVAADTPFAHDFREGAKGVQLAELALASWRERRWVDVPDLTGCRAAPAGGDAALGGRRRASAGQVIRLPRPDGTLEPSVMREPVAWPAPAGPIQRRVAYAAAPVVCGALAGRLRARLRNGAAAGEPARHPALARKYVRSGARRLLGNARPGRGDGSVPRDHPRAPRPDRWNQDLAVGCRAGGGAARPPSRRRAHVYR